MRFVTEIENGRNEYNTAAGVEQRWVWFAIVYCRSLMTIAMLEPAAN